MTGIMLNTVDEELKTMANSLASLSYYLFGYLPSPFLYAIVYDSGQGNHSTAAMATLMLSPIVAVVAYYIVGYLIIRDDILGYKALELEGNANCSSWS